MTVIAYSKSGRKVGEVEAETFKKAGQSYTVYKNFKPMKG